MKTLDKLIESILSDPNVKRFKQLESIIDQDKDLQQQYKTLLNAQKDMVQKEYKGHKDYEQAKAYYDQLHSEILEHVLMSEYLDLLEILNDDINLIQTIIEEEVNKNLD